MSTETYEEHLGRGGVEVDPSRVTAFMTHQNSCAVCVTSAYSYIRCNVGLRLAAEATKPLTTRNA